MKKQESILKRIRFLEEKYGIRYAKPDGKLFATLRLLYLFAFIFHSVMVLLFMIGMLLVHANTDNWQHFSTSFWLVCGAQAVAIGGIVLLFSPYKLWGCVASLLPPPIFGMVFGRLLVDDMGFFGMKTSFYWRHFAPLALMFILTAWMLGIFLRAETKVRQQYKKIVNNLYRQYHVGLTVEDNDLSETQWEAFLASYDPRNKQKTEE
ncbi:MAG: hypothetical protein IKI29_04995 [Clostridia bacterium]|nr:hypothetical protein [Clostridia bacterium]